MTDCPLLDRFDEGGIYAEVCHMTGQECPVAAAAASSRHCLRKAWYLDQDDRTRKAIEGDQDQGDQSGGVSPVRVGVHRGILAHPTKGDQSSQQ